MLAATLPQLDDHRGSGRIETMFLNTLTEQSESAIALGILVEHRATGEEKILDVLLTDDRISTVLGAIRQHLGAGWAFVESWELN